MKTKFKTKPFAIASFALAMGLLINAACSAVTYAQGPIFMPDDSSIEQAESLTKMQLAQSVYGMVNGITIDSDYKKYSQMFRAVGSEDYTLAQQKHTILAIMPEADLEDLAEGDLLTFILTLPNSMMWLTADITIQSLENELGGERITIESLQTLDEEALRYAYAWLDGLTKELDRGSVSTDLFNLVSRIYTWDSFRGYQENDRVIHAINTAAYLSGTAQSVLSSEKVPGSTKTLWDFVDDTAMKSEPAYEVINHTLETKEWGTDDESLTARSLMNNLRGNFNQAMNVIEYDVDWNKLNVNNPHALTEMQLIAKAQQLPAYRKYARLDEAMGDLLCGSYYYPEAILGDTSALEEKPNEKARCCIMDWWSSSAKQEAGLFDNRDNTSFELFDENPMEQIWPILGTYQSRYYKSALELFVSCTKESCSEVQPCEEGICEIFNQVKVEAEKFDQTIAAGLNGCNGEPEIPEVPDTGGLWRNADGGLTDLSKIVILGSAGLASVIGVSVIVRLYTRRRF